MNLSDYIQLPREQRIAHIDLTSECILGKAKNTRGARRSLVNYLGVEQDIKRREIQCCHLCPNNSKAEQHCLNPLHMYIGTRTENEYDKPAGARSAAAKKARAASLAKSTPEERSERARRAVAAKLEKYTREEIAAQTKAGVQTKLTPEQRSERSRKANASRTPEQRSDIARRVNAIRWGHA